MLDALAVGDDTDAFCQEEAALCTMKHEEMLTMAQEVVRSEEEHSRKKTKRKRKRKEDGNKAEL